MSPTSSTSAPLGRMASRPFLSMHSTVAPVWPRRFRSLRLRPAPGAPSGRRTALGWPKMGTSPRTRAMAVAPVRSEWDWADSVSSTTSAPARTCSSRSLARRQKATASVATSSGQRDGQRDRREQGLGDGHQGRARHQQDAELDGHQQRAPGGAGQVDAVGLSGQGLAHQQKAEAARDPQGAEHEGGGQPQAGDDDQQRAPPAVPAPRGRPRRRSGPCRARPPMMMAASAVKSTASSTMSRRMRDQAVWWWGAVLRRRSTQDS